MRILTVADEPDEYLWSTEVREALEGVDMIIFLRRSPCGIS